ncbi:MAG TPA: nuclear transport factor 2 family protein [Advenella sp.]|nr:nuclear transport factor 2 family protein [Advenella sp.]
MNHERDRAVAAVRNLYARQAHLIDNGRHDDWAHTFTPDGEFHSPTYGQPAVGYEQLAGISKAFAQAAQQSGERQRHLVDNIWVVECEAGAAQVRAYLSIVATKPQGGETRILRIVTLEDQLALSEKGWQVRRRTVTY